MECLCCMTKVEKDVLGKWIEWIGEQLRRTNRVSNGM